MKWGKYNLDWGRQKWRVFPFLMIQTFITPLLKKAMWTRQTYNALGEEHKHTRVVPHQIHSVVRQAISLLAALMKAEGEKIDEGGGRRGFEIQKQNKTPYSSLNFRASSFAYAYLKTQASSYPFQMRYCYIFVTGPQSEQTQPGVQAISEALAG